jgi:hypothetical protein
MKIQRTEMLGNGNVVGRAQESRTAPLKANGAAPWPGKRRAFCGGLRRATWSTFGRGFTDELDVVRWRPQREVVRDILLSAAECGAWLTIEELRGMTRFPEASIGAYVRSLRTWARLGRSNIGSSGVMRR